MLKEKSKSEKIYMLAIAFITLIGLLHCMYYVLDYGSQMDFFHYDERNYIACAERIAWEGRFSFWGEGSDAYVSPGFPLFLALFFKLFGSAEKGIVIVRVLQGFLGGSITLMTALLARKLTGKKSVAIIAASVVALNAQIACYCRYMLTETLYFFFLFLFCNVYLIAIKRQERALFAASGFLFAAAVLVRPPIACIIPLLVLFTYLESRKKSVQERKKLWQNAGFFAAAFIVLCMPWWIRNIITLKKLVLFSTQTNAFFYGFCPDPLQYNLRDPGTIWGNVKYIWMFFKDDPLGMLYYMTIGKFNGIFLSIDDIVQPVLQTAYAMLSNTTVSIGFTGLIVSLVKQKKNRRLIITILYFIVMTFLVIPVARYGVQFAPFLAIFGGLLIVNACKGAEIEEHE